MAGTEIFGNEEIKAVSDVIERKMIHRYGSHHLRDGYYLVEDFENKAKEIAGTRYALGVANGTAALIVGLHALGVGPGDEVITTPFSFIATVEAIVACGAVPVLGDIDGTLGLDPATLENYITPRTKAILPVHMFGAACKIDAIAEIAEKHGLFVVEDACEVVGGTYKGKALGSFGDVGAWSFDPNKTLTVGEGGMALTDSYDLYYAMDCYHDHGHIHSKEHDRGAEGKNGFGVNYRLSEIQGALGTVALGKMDCAINSLRKNKKAILDALTGTGLSPRPMHNPEGDTASHLIFMLPTAEAAKKFQAAAKAAGCGCGIIADNTWHYAKHWDALKEMSGKDVFGVKAPQYGPETMKEADAVLSRAAMFGLSIKMDEAALAKVVKAAKAGAEAAL
jgi:8-amino-3,8-dideoxy-alpha-D-manno-octulosonate transaminase